MWSTVTQTLSQGYASGSRQHAGRHARLQGGTADGTGAEARFAFCKWIYVPPVPGSIHERSYEVCFVASLAIDDAGNIYAATQATTRSARSLPPES